MVASYIVVGVMAVIALGLLEPANIAVLFELKKPRPNPAVIERLMKRFIYSAGVTGAMQIATLVIMAKLASRMRRAPDAAGDAARDGVAGADRGRRHLPLRPPPAACPAHARGDPAGPLGALLAVNFALLSRVKGFAWARFVGSPAGRCSPTRSSPGLILYAFLRDHLRAARWSC